MTNPKIFQKVIEGKIKKFDPTSFIGVYFLVKNEEIIYIGQSIRIPYRIDYHSRMPIFDFDSAFYINCAEKDLNEIEKKYLHLFNPEYNRNNKNNGFNRLSNDPCHRTIMKHWWKYRDCKWEKVEAYEETEIPYYFCGDWRTAEFFKDLISMSLPKGPELTTPGAE